MVRTIPARYACGICGQTYGDIALAEACEAQGIPAGPELGQFVGYGEHGWWKSDTTWTVWRKSTGPKDGMWDGVFGREPGGELGAPPVRFIYRPIWRVVGSILSPFKYSNQELGSHDVRPILWTPRHANTAAEAGERILQAGGAIKPVEPEFHPTLTPEEERRYAHLVKKLAKPEEAARIGYHAY